MFRMEDKVAIDVLKKMIIKHSLEGDKAEAVKTERSAYLRGHVMLSIIGAGGSRPQVPFCTRETKSTQLETHIR